MVYTFYMETNAQPTTLFANSPGPLAADQPEVNVPQTVPPQPVEQPPQDQPLQPQTAPSPQNSQAENQESQQFFPDYVRPQQEELIYEWQAASRPFKKHKRNFYTTVTVIVILISLILFFSGQFLPIAVVIAVTFLAYVLTSIPPHDILYQITTFGIRIEGKLYVWELMGRFWYTQKYGQRLVHVEVAQFPERLTMVLGEVPEEITTAIFSEILVQQTPAPTMYERVAKWLQEKIPLDLDS